MNSIKLLFGGVFLLVTSFVFWSCKDDFTEEDLLKQQAKNDSLAAVQDKNFGEDSTALSIIVFNASTTSRSTGGRTSATEALTGITVKISAQGSVKSATTTADGIVNFWVQPGAVSGTLSGAGFATANFTISVTEAAENEGVTNATVEIPAFGNAAATGSTVSGVVTYEGNLLNNERELVPNGTVISFEPLPSCIESYYTEGSGSGAELDAYSLEGNFVATTTSGAFTITLPSGVNGLLYKYKFPDFTADQSIAINGYENEVYNNVRAVATIPTRFVTSSLPYNSFTVVPEVNPIQIDIADPGTTGSGAAVTVSLLPKAVATSFTLKASGSGYPVSSTTVPVTVNGGDFDATVAGSAPAALTATTDANGHVTSIGGTLGFGYRSQATITVGGGGAGAAFLVNYTSTVANPFGVNALATSGTAITAGGSGYDVAPTLIIRGYDLNGNYIEASDASVTVLNGAVVGISMSGTNFAKLLAASPAIFRSADRTAAVADVSAITMNSLGELSLPAPSAGVGIANGGSGYTFATPPAVTVRALRAGTGATLGAVITSSGTVDYLYLIARGSGYPALWNANYPTSSMCFSTTGILSGVTSLRPGINYTLNAYYGTGIKTKGVQEAN